MKDTEQARMLLSMARKDMSALQGMTDSEIFAEEIFGFHVQQVAEKTLKAWLASLARTIHKYCRALACSFARNESFVSRPYALLRTSSSESVASKCPA